MILMVLKILDLCGEYIIMSNVKKIRIVENGVEKETTDIYCKKEKLDKHMNSTDLEKLLSNKEKM